MRGEAGWWLGREVKEGKNIGKGGEGRGKDEGRKLMREKLDEVAQWCIDDLPQKVWLAGRFNELWRYDDESVPRRVLEGAGESAGCDRQTTET